MRKKADSNGHPAKPPLSRIGAPNSKHCTEKALLKNALEDMVSRTVKEVEPHSKTFDWILISVGQQIASLTRRLFR